ncbi:AMP-binding protein [Pseudonocardia broussonetiae]|uniref:AMP-binding protein n=1 Tax=Pseudonocardia broussonetiae TaxID=2736640 RepID=A0A6M6JM99_9PSEU|nr:AMP-binding protein [Pseudonocardia broussonetiae]QJY48067.1 AMP-binding protein [Pseudonocardia broussonetiae]
MSAAVDVTYSRLIVDALTARPEREAFVQGDRRLTYGQTADLTGRIQQVLAEHGIGPGTGVGTLSPNLPEAWMVQAATYLLGGRYSGLHPLGSVDDHVRLCADADVRVLVVHPDHAETAAAVAARSPGVEHVLGLGGSELGKDLLVLADAMPSIRLDAGPAGLDDVAWLQFTGGTTGEPKGVPNTQRACAAQAQIWLSSYGVPDRARYLASSPITHAALLTILPTFLRGGTVVLHRGFDPEAWLATVAAERIDIALMVPTMVSAVLDALQPGRHDLSSMRTLLYGAAPMSRTRIAEAWERIGPVLRQGYACSEAGGPIAVLEPDDHDPAGARPELLDSCGRTAIGVRTAILDPDGHPVPDGEVGEICVRAPGVMAGYWRRPDLSAQVLRHGWLYTGDMGRRDDQGYLYLVDRSKDMIITGGFNVYPREVEDVLMEHPALAAAAVIGTPDPRWGEAVRAVVTLRPGTTVDPAALGDELKALVRRRKGPHYAPKAVEVVDALPTTPVGKIDKKALRAPYWAGHARQVN